MDTSYYQEELKYLRDLGAEYARRHPETAPLLDASAHDPDVERLLQGFAFLTARLHERLDDQYCQVAEGFLSVLWPQVLRSVPSFAMVQFQLGNHYKNAHVIDRGTELLSVEYGWGQYRFQTCRKLSLYPFRLQKAAVETSGDGSLLRLTFALHPGVKIADLQLGSLPIHIFGNDSRFTHGWYLALTQHAQSAHLVGDAPGSARVEVCTSPIGFGHDEPLFPDSDKEVPGHRILREFFAFPAQFLGIVIDDLTPLKRLPVEKSFSLEIRFGSTAPSGPLLDIRDNSFLTHCVPAVNLFRTVARVSHDFTRREYLVRTDEQSVERMEIYTVDSVEGVEQGHGGRRVAYVPFQQQAIGERKESYYRVRYADIDTKIDDRPLRGRDCYLLLEDTGAASAVRRPQIVTIGVTCTHRGGAVDLKLGDLSQPGDRVPTFVTFRNITEPTHHQEAPQSRDNLWLLISGLTMSRQTLGDLGNIKRLLRLHSRGDANSRRLLESWLNGLVFLNVEPGIVIEHGTLLRSLGATLEFECESYRTPEFYLFGVVLAEFLTSMATINTRMRFVLRFRNELGAVFTWPQKAGTCKAV